MDKVICFSFVALLAVGCNQPAESAPKPAVPAPGATAEQAKATPAGASRAAASMAAAKVGQPAPDFSLSDLDGKVVKLSDFKGKTVVIEWFNPGCPFVQLAHRKGGLKETPAKEIQKGVVWLAINSSAAGKQGYGREANVKAKAEFGMSYPVLLDEKGDVGRAYGAEHTPHMYIVDPKGTLVYKGAIDSSKGGEPEANETVTNYVHVALNELAAGKPVSNAENEAFGCSVKY
jgi:peroxiredoxin